MDTERFKTELQALIFTFENRKGLFKSEEHIEKALERVAKSIGTMIEEKIDEHCENCKKPVLEITHRNPGED